MSQTDPGFLRLKKAALALACVFLCLLCVVTGLLLSILMDVRRQVNSLREQTTQVGADLTHLKASVIKALEPVRLAGAVQRGMEKLPVAVPDPPAANAAAQREIAHLLQCIGRPELSCEYEGKQRPAEWVQMKLNGKAVLLGIEFTSAEEFIDKVASRTGEGAIYYVLDKDGQKAELQGWLRERLQEYRLSAHAQ